MFLLAMAPGSPYFYTLHVDWEAWEGRLGVLVRNVRTMKMVYWVNVSESSCTSLAWLSEMNWTVKWLLV